jgi:hypothetical protein
MGLAAAAAGGGREPMAVDPSSSGALGPDAAMAVLTEDPSKLAAPIKDIKDKWKLLPAFLQVPGLETPGLGAGRSATRAGPMQCLDGLAQRAHLARSALLPGGARLGVRVPMQRRPRPSSVAVSPSGCGWAEWQSTCGLPPATNPMPQQLAPP